MSTIYEESLIDAKKLKEVAQLEAQNALLNALAPEIKKMINKEVAGLSSPLFEQIEEPDLTLPSDNTTKTSSVDTVVGSNEELPPITAKGEEMLNMPLPGVDGKLIVDFEQLFSPSEENTEMVTNKNENDGTIVPQENSMETAVVPNVSQETVPESIQITGGRVGDMPDEDMPDQTMMSYETFKNNLDEVAIRIDRAFKRSSLPNLVKETLQDKLFQLYEIYDRLSVEGKISSRIMKIHENRLEFLHMKLEEASMTNTYNRIEKDNHMANRSLKKFASRLFEETVNSLEGGEVTSPADSHKKEGALKVDNAATEKGADKAGEHAKNVSKPKVTLKTEAKDEDLDENKIFEAELKKLEAELKEVLAAEEGEQDLVGAASSIPDEEVGPVDTTKSVAGDKSVSSAKVLSVKKEAKHDDEDEDLDERIEHSKDSGSEEDTNSFGHPVKEVKDDEDEDEDLDEVLEVKDDELAEEVRRIRKESIKRKIKALKEQLESDEDLDEMMGGYEDEAMMGGVPGAMSSAKPTMEDEELDEHGTTINFNFDLGELGDELADMGDDDEIEIVDDEDEVPPMSTGHEELGDEESGDEDDLEDEIHHGLNESRKVSKKLSDSKTKVSKKALNVVKENKELKNQLSEQQLWNAKVMYGIKFLQKEDLSKNQKQKIVEYLDKAKTLEEAKAIYGRIKKLIENTNSKKVGSSSQVTKSGSPVNSINESKEPGNIYEGATLEATSRNRLMELAGLIKK